MYAIEFEVPIKDKIWGIYVKEKDGFDKDISKCIKII